MIELLREIMPEELAWNVLKYMRHPLAEIIAQHFEIIDNLKRCRQNSILNMKIMYRSLPNINTLFALSSSNHNEPSIPFVCFLQNH